MLASGERESPDLLGDAEPDSNETIIMSHIVLLGDSIFDNAAYVPGEPAVIEQVRERLSGAASVTLLAVDGDVTADVSGQLEVLPGDATHLFVSVGGNDALRSSHLLASSANVIAELTETYRRFAAAYQSMLSAVLGHRKPTTVCTIYDSIPGIEQDAVMALSIFNDIILRSAFARGLPVIDLRQLCNQPEDYSATSPIEPSCQGGEKIAKAICKLYTSHDFAAQQSTVYA
jgi:hypothetical protein